jgi:hypothetical protein
MGELLSFIEGSMASRVWGNKIKLKRVEFIGRHAASLSAAEEAEVVEEAVLAEFELGRCSSIAVVADRWE